MGQHHPGHPEHRLTPGVEVTTGPLGQGIGNAVGMAMGARRERGLFDRTPRRAPTRSTTTCTASCPTGTSRRASATGPHSLAAHQELGNLIVLYDDNQISIEDNTNIAGRGRGHALRGTRLARAEVDWVGPRGGYNEDVGRPSHQAFQAAREHTEAPPSLPILRTIIGWPAPNKKGTGASPRRSALGVPRSRRPRRSCTSTPGSISRSRTGAEPCPRRVAERGARALTRSGRRGSPPGPRPTRRPRPVRPDGRAPAAGRLDRGRFPADAKGMATRGPPAPS